MKSRIAAAALLATALAAAPFARGGAGPGLASWPWWGLAAGVARRPAPTTMAATAPASPPASSAAWRWVAWRSAPPVPSPAPPPPVYYAPPAPAPYYAPPPVGYYAPPPAYYAPPPAVVYRPAYGW